MYPVVQMELQVVYIEAEGLVSVPASAPTLAPTLALALASYQKLPFGFALAFEPALDLASVLVPSGFVLFSGVASASDKARLFALLVLGVVVAVFFLRGGIATITMTNRIITPIIAPMIAHKYGGNEANIDDAFTIRSPVKPFRSIV